MQVCHFFATSAPRLCKHSVRFFFVLMGVGMKRVEKGGGRTVQSLHFELLRAKFRVYFEFRNTEISHAILLRPNSAAQLLIFFVVSRHFGTVLRFKTK